MTSSFLYAIIIVQSNKRGGQQTLYNYKGYTIEPYYEAEVNTTLYIVYDENGNKLNEWFDSLNDAKYHIDHINEDEERQRGEG